jgi:NAD(P) transhydrogenase subunit alpha
LSADASSLYARNMVEFVQLLVDENKNVVINMDDELVKGSLITKDGETFK